MQASGHRYNVEKPPKVVFITDLDRSDADPPMENTAHRKEYKKRTKHDKHKVMQTMTGNFSRSRSAECHVRQVDPLRPECAKSRSSKIHNHLNDVLQTKEKEIEKMFQRIVTLQRFNEQFSVENTKLRQHVQNMELQIEELYRKIDACEGCQNLTSDVTELTGKNIKLNADLEMMKTLVYRLNVQIEYYQDKERHKNEALPDEDGGGNEESSTTKLQPWQVAAPLYTHTLGPLLKSYDEMIRDKEELFQEYRKEFEHFSNELKRILEENNSVVKQYEQLKRDVGSWREERTRYNAALVVCRQRAETHAQMSDLTKEKLVEVVEAYEQKVQSMGLEIEHIKCAYTRSKSELSQLKTVQALPQDSISNSLQQCKDLLERLKSEHSDEKTKMQHKIEELSKSSVLNEVEIKEMRQQNAMLNKELAQAQCSMENMKEKFEQIKMSLENVTRSRAAMKTRLHIALQWAEKLEKGQSEIKGTWDALKRLETIVKHKEAQVRGLHARHMEEIEKLQNKLRVKEDTIRKILKQKVTPNISRKEDIVI